MYRHMLQSCSWADGDCLKAEGSAKSSIHMKIYVVQAQAARDQLMQEVISATGCTSLQLTLKLCSGLLSPPTW